MRTIPFPAFALVIAAAAFLVLPGSLRAHDPVLELEPPAGAPFTTGEVVTVPIFLHLDEPGIKFVAFGIEVGSGAEFTFVPSHDILALEGVEHFGDRFLDVRHMWAGVGNFDFRDPTALIPTEVGRVHLGEIRVSILDPDGASNVALSVGQCRCRTPEGVDEPLVDIGDRTQLDVGGDTMDIQLGDEPFSRGDANRDGSLDIGDPLQIVYSLFLKVSIISCQDSFDANDDGALDVSDPSYLLNHLFLGGPAPPAPYPGEGADPTADSLSCKVF